MSYFIEKLKITGQEIFLFLSSKIFLKNFVGIICVISCLFTLSFIWMSSYTNHGQYSQVPNYLNMNIDRAVQQADEANLRVVVNDSIWSNEKPAGTVLEQHPKPLTKVKENRTTYLTISKYQPEKKLLPTLSGNDNFNFYARRLKQLKISLKVKRKEVSNRLEGNTILYLYINEQKVTPDDLKKGLEVLQGSTVEAVITTRDGIIE